ncbi:hypothetical protein BDZ94DRAFT_1254689 [Collybia nuda]|uniref:Secreted protein n=1 Tax=Collybia nuda TaxID=64659 RepID=A0A9P5YC65_9AGAR|nr:hypothetical protein BDZ94DRAFT_1254689 [Collybia nuda]
MFKVLLCQTAFAVPITLSSTWAPTGLALQVPNQSRAVHNSNLRLDFLLINRSAPLSKTQLVLETESIRGFSCTVLVLKRWSSSYAGTRVRFSRDRHLPEYNASYSLPLS